MTYYNPIFDDITKLPDNLIIPKTECDYSYVIVESDPKVVFKFLNHNQNIDNLCYPLLQWPYESIVLSKPKTEITEYETIFKYEFLVSSKRTIEYYNIRNHREKMAIEFASLQRVNNIKQDYNWMQSQILSFKNKEEFILTQSAMLNRLREMQVQYLNAKFDLNYCLKAYIPVYLLSNGQLIKLKPKRNN